MSKINEAKYDRLIDLLFQVLPADSPVQITTRVNKLSNVRYNVSQVNGSIAHLRKNALRYGWTIPHVPRGAGYIKDRYQAAVHFSNGKWHIDPAAYQKMIKGNSGTLSEAATKTENNAVGLEIIASQLSPARARLLKRIARDQKHHAVQIRDIMDEEAVA